MDIVQTVPTALKDCGLNGFMKMTPLDADVDCETAIDTTVTDVKKVVADVQS